FAEGDAGTTFDGDVVVVVDPAEVGQLEVTGERGGLVRDALHEVTVAALHPNVVVEQVEAGPIVARRQPATGDGHTDAVATALAERTRRRLDARRVAIL